MGVEEITVELNAETWTYPQLGRVVVVGWIDDEKDPFVISKGRR
jgi:hypothetical protein